MHVGCIIIILGAEGTYGYNIVVKDVVFGIGLLAFKSSDLSLVIGKSLIFHIVSAT